MELPNIEELCKEFLSGDKWVKYSVLNCVYGSVNTENLEKDHITSSHLFGWWPESMHEHLVWAGFTEIVFMPEQIPHPPKPSCNMRVEAKKSL
jgi:hypothetical protein